MQDRPISKDMISNTRQVEAAYEWFRICKVSRIDLAPGMKICVCVHNVLPKLKPEQDLQFVAKMMPFSCIAIPFLDHEGHFPIS